MKILRRVMKDFVVLVIVAGIATSDG